MRTVRRKATLKRNAKGIANLIPFKKNDPRINRNGPPKLPPEVKALKNLTTEKFITDFNDLLVKSHRELWDIAYSVDEPILRVYVARCLVQGKMHGDYFMLNMMLDRLIGKVVQPITTPPKEPLIVRIDGIDAKL